MQLADNISQNSRGRITRNLHTHTYRCKHAEGDVEDYCKSALQLGLKELGISDHTPLPDNRWDFVRMDIRDLADYFKMILMAKSQYDQLNLYMGMECDFDIDYMLFYEEELLGKYNCDYLIGSVHWFPHNGEWININDGPTTQAELFSYISCLIQAISTGKFLFIAHPDVFCQSYRIWDENCVSICKDLFTAASYYNIPLEINGLGFRKAKIFDGHDHRRSYPSDNFWELAAEFNLTVICNSDAHRPEDLIANIDDGNELAHKYGLHHADIKINH
jgi:histidinol-phosphatase (PHP family)